MTLIIILMMMPVFAIVAKVSQADSIADSSAWIVKLFPYYVLLSGGCAYLAYPQRPLLSWIVLVVLLLSYPAMLVLINN